MLALIAVENLADHKVAEGAGTSATWQVTYLVEM